MTTRRRHIAAILLAVGLCAAIGTSAHGQTFTQPIGLSGWQRDLDFLVGTIKGVHPRPFHLVPEQQFDSAVSSLRSRLPALADPEAALGLMRLVALVADGHTRLEPGGKVMPVDRWYPVRIDRFADGYFVVATSPAHRDLLGAEVISIGGRAAADAWEAVARLAPGDNAFSRMAAVPVWLMMPELMAALGIGHRDRLEFEVRIGGRRRVTSVSTMAVTRGIRVLLEDAVPGDSSLSVPAADTNVDLPFRWPSDWYWFQHERDTGLLYARINVVSNADKPVHLDEATVKLTLREFGERLLARIDSGGVRTVVIDLRKNPGGNNALIVPLVRGLASRAAVNVRGRLFVITGRATYSAAMNFTSLLEAETAALFVGEPPGGSPSHYGDATSFTLPVSGLTLFVSTLHWDLGVRPTDVREEHEPDLRVPPRFAEIAAGRDEALAAVRTWPAKSTLADHLLERYRRDGIDSAVAAARSAVAASEPGPWQSRLQQVATFARNVISSGGSAADIYRAHELATELYPDSPVAWFALGRVYLGRRPREAETALARAHALRPGHELIARLYRAASLQAASSDRSDRRNR